MAVVRIRWFLSGVALLGAGDLSWWLIIGERPLLPIAQWVIAIFVAWLGYRLGLRSAEERAERIAHGR